MNEQYFSKHPFKIPVAAPLKETERKTSENLWFSIWRGYRKRPVAWNGLIAVALAILDHPLKRI